MPADDDLFADEPGRRLVAARSLGSRARRRLLAEHTTWPDHSPASRNAWLLLVTTKAPAWRDPLLTWPRSPLTLGAPHPGFLYPDPIGFWDEVRRWCNTLLRSHEPTWSTAECLAVAALVHVGERPQHLSTAIGACRPRLLVFLDEQAWETARLDVATERLAIPDPHRSGQTYEGWWGVTADGRVVGKSPQHPAMHRVYRADDLDAWLRSAPRPRGAMST